MLRVVAAAGRHAWGYDVGGPSSSLSAVTSQRPPYVGEGAPAIIEHGPILNHESGYGGKGSTRADPLALPANAYDC